jgi:hypothetical protein
MNRWAAAAILSWIVLAASGACQGPDAFYRSLDGGRSSGGGSLGGLGGAPGLGGSGLGGSFGSGGARGTGGAVFAGVGGARGTGGAVAGVGGARATGGTSGGAGARGTGGATGMGGRTGGVDAGPGCVTTLRDNGYMAGTATPCRACMENRMSLTAKCMAMIDCLVPSCESGTCFTDCLNSVSGSDPLNRCVQALVNAACGP